MKSSTALLIGAMHGVAIGIAGTVLVMRYLF